MAIRRRVTKVTIDEVNDSAEIGAFTNVPASLTGLASLELYKGTPTDIPEAEDIEETDSPQDTFVSPVTIGRTFPDLLVDFKNDTRAMATVLTFLPFIVFVTKIDSIGSLKYPIIAGVILNAVWFGVPLAVSFCRFLQRIWKR